MKTKTKTLTEQELEIMKVIWERPASTVRDVYEALQERRPVAYTTVMTMMNILESKGHLVKRPEGRAWAALPGLPFFHHRGHLRERVAQLSKEVSMSRPRIATVVTACAAVLALTAFLGASSFPMLGSAWAGSQSGTKPMKVAGDVQRPKPISQPFPAYPEAAKAAKAEGMVVVDCVIDEQGHVTQTKVSMSSGREDLDTSARDAISTWSFQPATLKGKPVAVSFTITLNFKLDEKDKKQQ